MIGSRRFEVLGYRDNGKMVLADAEDVDGESMKKAAYETAKHELSDAWKKKKRPPDDEDDDEDNKRKRKPSDNEFELAGPLSDQQSADIKRAAWEQSVRDLQDAWRR